MNIFKVADGIRSLFFVLLLHVVAYQNTGRVNSQMVQLPPLLRLCRVCLIPLILGWLGLAPKAVVLKMATVNLV